MTVLLMNDANFCELHLVLGNLGPLRTFLSRILEKHLQITSLSLVVHQNYV